MTFEVTCPRCNEIVQIPFPKTHHIAGQTDQCSASTPQKAPVSRLNRTASACVHLMSIAVFGGALGAVIGGTLFCLTIPVKLTVSSEFATLHGFSGDLNKNNEFFTQLFIKSLATSAVLGIAGLSLWTWKKIS